MALAQVGVKDPVLAAAAWRLDPLGRGRTDFPIGPDVIVGGLHNTDNNGNETLTLSVIASNATHVAYGVGTTSCNRGDQNVLWIANTNEHPVIPQNLYRLSRVNGATRLEQVGQSWLKHAFTALTQNACGFGCNGQGGSVLGVGCSDPYTASRNAGSGNNSNLGPRYHVNAYTGYFPYPFNQTGIAPPAPTDTLVRRLRVARSDLVTTTNTTETQYFVEALYVTGDDARWGNGKNNASYRRGFVNSNLTITLTDTTRRTLPAIYAWRDYGNVAPGQVPQADPNVMISEVSTGGTFSPPSGTPTGDGWHLIASRATDLGNGTWHYEYAVENISSDRMGGSFTVPIPAGVTVSNVEWKGVESHGGWPAEDATRNAPWTITVNGNSVVWAAPAPYDPSFPFNGNGIRWGTLYNFRFDANAAPTTGTVTLGFFKPMAGWPDSVTGAAWVPAGPACYANCDGSTAPPILNVADFTCFLQRFAAGEAYANCDGSTTPPILNVADFTCFLQRFAQGCP